MFSSRVQRPQSKTDSQRRFCISVSDYLFDSELIPCDIPESVCTSGFSSIVLF